ncbi:MAG TPA: GAF domain-containing protein [Candidatus Baltobacteraceae bacterium]|nr:GAF domain-containing protein [Candidatus Baltobacteraceae bacterium]
MARRVLIVVLLSLLSISLWAPDVRRAFGHPLGILFIGVTRHGSDVRLLTSNSGGFSLADRYVDLAASPVVMRLRWLRNNSCWMATPGQTCNVRLIVDGRRYASDRPAPPEDPADGVYVLARVALAFIWLCCGACLVLLRPSKATWAFFALSLYGWSPNNIVTEVGPVWLQVAMTAFENAWEVTIPFAACAFALYLLEPPIVPVWRSGAIRLTYLAAFASAAFAVIATYLTAYGASNAAMQAFDKYYSSAPIAAIVTPLILLATYLQGERAARQRIRWVLVGFSAGLALMIATSYLAAVSYAAYSAAQGAYVFCITASTMYAVLRHRIIDVNVVLSRTLVYTLLSALVVGLFALVDLFFSRALSQSNAGLIADVALALVLGFFMNGMHHRIDRFVDGILFRSRHLAEQHVALVAQALRHAEDERAVNRMLVDEPVRSFDLQFGVLARRMGADALVIAYSCGGVAVATVVSDAETLCAYLATERKPLLLRHHYWNAAHLRHDDVEPSIAVPVFSHEDLTAVVFFAPHRNGTELDGDELTLIDRVADAAGAAYDRLETKALRERLGRLTLEESPA